MRIGRRAGWVSVAVLVACAHVGAEPSALEPPASEARPTREPEVEPQTSPAGVTSSSMESEVTEPVGGPQAPTEGASTVAPPMTVESVTGIPDCDAYLDLYARCEDFLRPEIMAGERRFQAAEKASLLHLANSPEAPALPGACAEMLDALRRDCPEARRKPTGGG